MLRGEDVRAPGEASGLLALESAMDELAHALNMDPIELRIRNKPAVDPERNVPYSERRVVECLREGARRFKSNRSMPLAHVRFGSIADITCSTAQFPASSGVVAFKHFVVSDQVHAISRAK
jgi:CO/xanthine dehydrogenase Mo-binding subunit